MFTIFTVLVHINVKEHDSAMELVIRFNMKIGRCIYPLSKLTPKNHDLGMLLDV